jgi:16S rRNA (adenine(1408)-N(1))-methyltransferase
MDLGTGDGRYVLDRAAADPGELVIGIDASAAAMAESSLRAFRAGRTNTVFVVGDARHLPTDLAGLAQLVTIHFPWGSLLHAALSADSSITRLLAPRGVLRLLVSASARDAAAGLTDLDPARVECAYRDSGLRVQTSRPATAADADDAHSSWGKRLLKSGDRSRQAWLFAFACGRSLGWGHAEGSQDR